MPLQELPSELLANICSFLDSPQSIASLALTSRKLHEFTELGWKAFLRGRFATIPLQLDKEHGLRSSDAPNIVHGLTTLYRNWDRKAFVARNLYPAENTVNLQTWRKSRWRTPQGQTMGYQPVIDSYDEHTSGEWAARREVLAWSAGTQIVMRIKGTRPHVRGARRGSNSEIPNEYLDHFNHSASWYTWEVPGASEGRDDITALKMLKPHQKSTGRTCPESIVFGTASGDLSLLNVDVEKQRLSRLVYETRNRLVGSLSLSPASEPILAACLSDSDLAIYSLPKDESTNDLTHPSSEVSVGVTGTRSGRVWSTNFISDERIALGLGPSFEPIQIYQIRPDGLSSQPIRKFDINELLWAGRGDHMGPPHNGPRVNASIYPIIPLSSDPTSKDSNSNVFLSGGYDGVIRLHDLRSSRGYEVIFSDPTSDAPIFSLQAQGQERFIAGTAQHSILKVFDVRLPGTCGYRSLPPSSISRELSNGYNTAAPRRRTLAQPQTGWDMYLSPPARSLSHQRYRDSPVYSISLPSPTSPFLYAGIEDSVLELAFTSVLDPHPDPIYAPTLLYSETGQIDYEKSWYRKGGVLDLGMYEWNHKSEGLGMKLLVQSQPSHTATIAGLDERWRDPSLGDKWRRGLEPPIPPTQPHGNTNTRRNPHRGRGRGRGRGARG